ncbi:MAG: hypothetical protein ACRDIY_17365 [Chloroflexota bacterium]
MQIVRARQVGNSIVISLPKALGITAGTELLIEQLPDGNWRLARGEAVARALDGLASRVVAEHREGTDLLAAWDRDQESTLAHG